jgi:GrpB-like predicted nucleotidyltransferase (UPF0157 family)
MNDKEPLGLKKGIVIIKPYDERWPLLYDAEAAEIRAALAGIALDMQHVGSTSVPGLSAKPIIDIALGLASLDKAERCKGPLETLGYEYAYWAGIDDDHVFGKGVERTHLIHAVEFGGDLWTNYLKFRDALRGSIELSRQYEELKTGLSLRFAKDRAVYTDEKSKFIRRVLGDNIV